jgi:tetratricopeptide (TPR) repeat protein
MEELYDYIDDYLRGQLTPDQQETFETKMQTDATFAKTVAEQRALQEGITAFGQTQLKADLQTMHQQLFGADEQPAAEARVRRLPWRAIAVAASIAIIAMAGYWVFFTGPDYEQLYASNFEHYSINFTNRTNASEPGTVEIQQQYQRQEYGAALAGLERLANNQPDQPRLQLALGLAYLAENQLPEAAATLQTVDDPLFQPTAQWYLALTYIRQKEKTKAIAILKPIAADSGSNRQQQAATLLEELQ